MAVVKNAPRLVTVGVRLAPGLGLDFVVSPLPVLGLEASSARPSSLTPLARRQDSSVHLD